MHFLYSIETSKAKKTTTIMSDVDRKDKIEEAQRSYSLRDLFIGFCLGFGAVIGTVAVSTTTLPENINKTPAVVVENSPPSNDVGRFAPENRRQLMESSLSPQPKDFLMVAYKYETDKVLGAACTANLTGCKDGEMAAENPKCKGYGHYYHTIYNKWLEKYSSDDAEPFQFLEIGFYNGKGFDAFQEFLPRAEMHSIEIACIEQGPRSEGKWPWENFPSKNARYQEYLDNNKLHCGSGTDYDFLKGIWDTKMKRPGAPPLKVVVEDASHLSDHMAKSLFFWFPRIEAGGILVVEDIQPTTDANKFRTDVLSQIMKDLHYCGSPDFKDKMCFPTLQPLLQSIHCEMHICIFERNMEPAIEPNKEDSMMPPHALNAEDCIFHSH